MRHNIVTDTLICFIDYYSDYGQYDCQGVYCGLSSASEVFLISTFYYPNTHVYAIIMQYFTHLEKREILQQEYSQPPILPSPHFRWVVIYIVKTVKPNFRVIQYHTCSIGITASKK